MKCYLTLRVAVGVEGERLLVKRLPLAYAW